MNTYQKPFTFKIFFRYFPKGLWIVFVGALLLRIFVPASDRLPFVIVNILLVFICIKIMVVIHEAGHLIAAYWVGATPKRMVLGSGHEIYRTEFKGVKVILNSIPLGGAAMATFGNVPHLRWRNAFYISGGPLFNAITILILYLLFGFDASFLTGSNGFSFASAMILASTIGVLNLLPMRVKRGIGGSTDGLLLLKVLFSSPKKLKSELNLLKYQEDYVQAFDYYENRQYDEARKIYQSLLDAIPDDFTSQSMLALVELKSLHFDEALRLLKTLEVKVNTKGLEVYKGTIYNNIAFTHILLNEPKEALPYADSAMSLLKSQSYVRGTYAAAQIENGNIDTGISWMMNEVDMDHPNDHTLTTSAYLALAYHLKDDNKARDKHLKFVRDNQDQLDNDTRFLFERNLQKMGIENH